MGCIRLIGTSNFRTFKTPISLELGPINIITGSNNSGKSSLSKLLLLIKDSLEKEAELQELDFRGQDHYLSHFENIINSESENKIMSIELPFSSFSTTNLAIILKYKAANKSKSYTGLCEALSIVDKGTGTTILEAKLEAGNDPSKDYHATIQKIGSIKINGVGLEGGFSSLGA